MVTGKMFCFFCGLNYKTGLPKNQSDLGDKKQYKRSVGAKRRLCGVKHFHKFCFVHIKNQNRSMSHKPFFSWKRAHISLTARLEFSSVEDWIFIFSSSGIDLCLAAQSTNSNPHCPRLKNSLFRKCVFLYFGEEGKAVF